MICLVEDYSRNISVKLLSKYLQRDNNKCQFSFFPIISFKKSSCQLLAKECALSAGELPRRLAQEQCG